MSQQENLSLTARSRRCVLRSIAAMSMTFPFITGAPPRSAGPRILDLCQQARSQGALLTTEDLAYRVFFVTPRTISRDLKAVRKANPDVLIPMHSTLSDIGPVLTHRVQIIKLALQGKTTSEICRVVRRSSRSRREISVHFHPLCPARHQPKMEVGQIAFLLRRGSSLVQARVDLLAECRHNPRTWNITSRNSSENIGSCGGGKKNRFAGGPPMNDQTGFLRKKFGPLKARSLKNAIANQITTEFPRIGGPRICSLCC